MGIARAVLGFSRFWRPSGGVVIGYTRVESSSTVALFVQDVASTYPTEASTSATVPFTWASGNAFMFHIVYETD